MGDEDSSSTEPYANITETAHVAVGRLVKMDPQSVDSGGWEEF